MAGLVERCHPQEIGVGLGCYHHEILLVIAKEACSALLALKIEGLHSAQKIVSGKFHDTAARGEAFRYDIRIKEALRSRLNILDENIADDCPEPVIAADEDIGQRSLKIHGPGHYLLPRARGAVQGGGGEGISQELVGAPSRGLPQSMRWR